jgi:DNA-binding MarR family transcriptional regulator
VICLEELTEQQKIELFNKCIDDEDYYYDIICNPILSPFYQEQLNKEADKTGISADECEKRLFRKRINLFELVFKEFSKEIVGEEKPIKTIFVICMSRLLKNKKNTSFHTIINSESGAGKDFILNRFESLFSDITIKYSRISAKALDYKGADKKSIAEGFTWEGKILILSDVNNDIINNDTLKTFLSDGSQTAIVNDGVLKERQISGIPVVLMSSYKCDPEHELLRRLNILNLDESKEQTRKIMEFEQTENINYNKLKGLINLFKPYKVNIPFRSELVSMMEDNIHMRTYFPKILDFVKTITIINQFHRKKTKNELIAEKEDYNVAKDILENMSYGTHYKPLSLNEKTRLKRLKELFGDKYFTLTEAVNEFGLAKSTMSEHLTKFEYDGYLERVTTIDDYDVSKIKYHIIEEIKPTLPNFI